MRRLPTMFVAAIILCGLTSAQDTKPPVEFARDADLQSVREVIQQNGYSFTVEDYTPILGSNFFVPGLYRSDVAAESTDTDSDVEIRIDSTDSDLPRKFDWRNKDGKSWIGPVRDQGPIGTCWAFATCASAESTYNVANNLSGNSCVDFSESYLAWSLAAIPPFIRHLSATKGADQTRCELVAMTEKGVRTGFEGVCFEQDFPYQTTPPNSAKIDASWKYPRVKFQSWGRIYPVDYDDTTDAIKTAIYTRGVVFAAVYVSNAFQAYKSGVYEDTLKEPDDAPYFMSSINHAIALVGWDDNPPEGGDGCWILRNSWGEKWGEKGYMRIRYKSAHVNCSAAQVMFTVTAPGSTEKPDGDDDKPDDGAIPTDPNVKFDSDDASHPSKPGESSDSSSEAIPADPNVKL